MSKEGVPGSVYSGSAVSVVPHRPFRGRSPLQSTFDPERRLLTLAFDGREEIEGFVGSFREQEGFLAAVPERLARGTEVGLVLTGPGGFELRLEAEALHVFGDGPEGFSTAFGVRGWNAAKRAELRRKLGDVASEEEGAEEARGETLGSSPMFRIQKMTPPEKARLALRANRTERRILLRETSPQVMMALLNNPHVESDDVLQMVKSPYAPGSVLKRVASDRRWSRSPDLRLALVKNPQTPTVLAKRLLPALPVSALQGLARSSEIREDLKKAALKLYLQRMGK